MYEINKILYNNTGQENKYGMGKDEINMRIRTYEELRYSTKISSIAPFYIYRFLLMKRKDYSH